MKRRIFIGLPLPLEIYPELEKIERKISKGFPSKIPWQPLENIHLTLAFIGWVESAQVEQIKQLLGQLQFRRSNEPGCVDKIDYGPPGLRRMIWLYLRPQPFLTNTKTSIEQILKANNIPLAEAAREFLPHCTLARLKISIKAKLPDIAQALNWPMVLNRLILYESILRQPWPLYVPLQTVSLL